jgi:hypothetical protein
MEAWYHPSIAGMTPNRRVRWRAISNDGKFLVTLGGAAAKHWAETPFYQYRRAKRSADINEKTFPKRF